MLVSGLATRLSTRYAIRAASQPGGWGTRAGAFAGRGGHGHDAAGSSTLRLRGRHLLDHEALTCLVVLLFVDEPRLNTGRLHRVLRNLCYHGQTRLWLIRALLSILQRTSQNKDTDERALPAEPGKGGDKFKKKSSQSEVSCSPAASGRASETAYSPAAKSTCPTWLSISLDAALGCRANVFQIQRSGSKKHSGSSPATQAHVSIHPQASPLVCRHVLDTLISLAKSFPNYFLPGNKSKEAGDTAAGVAPAAGCKSRVVRESDSKSNSTCGASPARAGGAAAKPDARADIDFWDLLVRLDSTSGCRKGKSVARTPSGVAAEMEQAAGTYEASPLGLLMTMLAHPVVRRSQLLTDRLLRLLGLISVVIPDLRSQDKQKNSEQSSSNASNANVTVTTANNISVAEIPLPPSEYHLMSLLYLSCFTYMKVNNLIGISSFPISYFR